MSEYHGNPTSERAGARSTTTTTIEHSAAADLAPKIAGSGSVCPVPEGVSPTLLLQYQERWVQEEQVPCWSEAMGKIALACAIYRTHSPALLSWRTGYRLPATKTFIDCLSDEEDWPAPENSPRSPLRDMRAPKRGATWRNPVRLHLCYKCRVPINHSQQQLQTLHHCSPRIAFLGGSVTYSPPAPRSQNPGRTTLPLHPGGYSAMYRLLPLAALALLALPQPRTPRTIPSLVIPTKASAPAATSISPLCPRHLSFPSAAPPRFSRPHCPSTAFPA